MFSEVFQKGVLKIKLLDGPQKKLLEKFWLKQLDKITEKFFKQSCMNFVKKVIYFRTELLT